MNLPVNYNNLSRQERRLVREEYIRRQDGLCYFCKTNLKKDPLYKVMLVPVTPSLYPRGFFDNKIHLHHDHETGMTMGAVHAHCNAVLFEYYGE